ncbi:MAG TPA: phage portal protein [Candidatus Krumholzibacteria bacterium]|nr:phage portal protein [Candidatus Krumholzibacteria bacterium]
MAGTWLQKLDDRIGAFLGRPDRIEQAVDQELSKREAPTIYTFPASSKARGIIDRKEPSMSQQRLAYVGTIFTVLNLRASAFAEACKMLEAQRRIGDDWKPVGANEPWSQLLARPSRIHPRLRLHRWESTVRDLSGKAREIIERDTRGVPFYLHPVYREFGRMQPVGNKAGEIEEYKFHPANGGAIQTFEARDVMEWTHPDPWTPYESMSLIEAAAFQIDAETAMHVYRRDNLREGGFSEIYLKSDQDLTEKQIRTYQRQMRAYRGSNAANAFPVLGKGLSIETATKMAKDLQFVEGAKLTHNDIFEIGGIPLALTAPDANLANAKAAFRVFYMITVQPMVNDYAETRTHQFERAFGAKPDALRIHAPNIVPTDQEEESRVWQRYVQTGLKLINEFRESQGLPPVEGGDVPLVSGISVALPDVVSKPEATPQKEPASTKAAKIEQRDERAVQQQYAEIWIRNDKKKQRHANKIQAVAIKLFDEQKRAVLKAIKDDRALDALIVRAKDEPPKIKISKIFSIAEWLKRALELFGPEIADALEAGFNNAIELLESDVDFTSSDPGVKKVIREINAKSKETVETTSRELEDEVQVGLENGETREQIAKRIEDKFDFISHTRAPVIGWTMATGGFEGGQQIAYEKAEVDEKMWLSQRDGRVRATHQKAHRQQVKVDEKFTVGESRLMYPGDPNGEAKEVIRCRCGTAPVLTKE